MKKVKHSKEWWEGYNCQQPRSRNPYAAGTEEYRDWLDGWEARFFGEKP